MVATPIGNLADVGLRALHVLALADTVACEDTRHTGGLLQAYGLHKPLLAVHEHNEAEAAATVLERLRAGQRVAYVSDAGTPGLSDPGARLVAAVRAAGLRCVPVPGPSSLTALISVTGFTPQGARHPGRFVFAGFLASKTTERQREIAAIGDDPRACVILEAPHRIEALASDLAALGERPLTVGRELTKQFEQVVQMPARELADWLQADPQRRRGEFVLIVHASEPGDVDDAIDPAARRALLLLMDELPLKSAVKVCADLTGLPRNSLYTLALSLRQADD